MSFQSLNKEELADVAEFFVVDVPAADEDKGPTKKELLAALASGEDPVTWDQYKEAYLVAKGAEPEVAVAAPVEAKPEPSVNVGAVDEEDAGEQVLIKYERKNPTWEVVGYTFTTKHPFKSVPVDVASYLIRKQTGFRLALPDEVTDFYN